MELDSDYRSSNGEYAGGILLTAAILRNLDVRSNMASADQPSVMDEAYKEFVMQLASWDTRREFWLQTDYYKQRMVGNSKADAALLDEMINNIVFILVTLPARSMTA